MYIKDKEIKIPMKFTMNGRDWLIKEVEQNELCEAHNDLSGEGCYFGTTFPSTQEIWLYKDVKQETKKKTLYHELMHCYMFSYISFNDINFSIDDFCDISANSHDIIHEIVENYFQLEAGSI